MTRHDPIKTRARVRSARTGESYVVSWAALADYPGPRREQLAAADAMPFTAVDGSFERYWHVVSDYVDASRPELQAELTIRPGWYRGEPMLAVDGGEVAQVRYAPSPTAPVDARAVWTLFCRGLRERGWLPSTEVIGTQDWRLELEPSVDAPSAPVPTRLHDGAGWVLYAGEAQLPPGWLARTRVDPVGLLVVAGPGLPARAGTRLPAVLTGEHVDHLLASSDVVAARIRVSMTWDPLALPETTALVIPEQERGVRALPTDATPAQRAVAEDSWRPMENAKEMCRCSGGCRHGQPDERDGNGRPCPGRLLHVDRCPGSWLSLTGWMDTYVCDVCDESRTDEVSLPDLPWGTPGGNGSEVEVVVFEGVRHRLFRKAASS